MNFLSSHLSQITVLLTLLLWLPAAIAESILLRNVSMSTQDESKEPITINILIKDRLLELISESDIPLDQADRTYNANGGYILGQLSLAQPASFLILSQDPKKDFRIFLDTKRYASFAIHDGKIRRNYLRRVTKESQATTAIKRGWTAYTPPPIAVPLNYQDSSRWNKFDGEFISGLFAGAIILDRQFWLDQNDASHQQVGNLKEDYEAGEIRAMRFGGVGTLNFDKPWVWTVFAATHGFDKGFNETNDDSFSFFDVRLDIPVLPKANVSIGKQKEPISMERLMTLVNLPMQERSTVSDALLPSRNVGIVVSSNFFDDRVSVAASAFNNWLDKDQPSSRSDNATQFIGRTTWAAIVTDQQSNILHLGLGLRHSNGKEGYATSVSPEFNNAPNFIRTELIDTDDIVSYQMEASFRSGPYWLHSEYIRTDVDNKGQQNDPSYAGYHITASWILTGEMRPYNFRAGIFGRVPVSRSVQQNGWGAIELSTRYSALDFSDDALTGGDMDIWSAGANWLLTPYTTVGLNYRYINLEQLGEQGHSQGLNLRLTLMLE